MRATVLALSLIASALGIEGAGAQSGSSLTPNQREILALAEKSKCAAHKWKWKHGADPAPKGFIKGVALLFAKSYCEHTNSNTSAVEVMRQPLGAASVDALKHYGAIQAIPSSTPLQRLEAIYTLALGLGMRESSGRTAIGAAYDEANPNPDANTAEAGLYQTSFNSMKNDWRETLYKQYNDNQATCYFDIFTQGTGTTISPAVGSGDGADFQQFTKKCPGFATEYVMVNMRLNRSHYGPLNSRSAEFENTCLAMFRAIESKTKCEP